ncbi:hypothetical protein M8J77_001736 [Diaphorina citri]|nr:hypothetical protein M8J77_001736 [Diaphorina citri]
MTKNSSCILQHFTNQSWTNVSVSSNINSTNYYNVTSLRPKTKYIFRLILLYNYSNSIHYWPQKYPFYLFETLGDRPSTPIAPTVAIQRVVWEAPRDNGDPIILYWLEARSPTSNWTMCFTGPDPFWQIKSEFLHNTHRFRVRAYNSYGWSEFSDPSIQFYLSYQEPITSFMAPFGALSAAVIIFASLCTVCVIKCKKSGFGFKSNNCKLQDSELDHLRCENLVETRNPLYVSSADYTPTDADIAALPKIKRDQITLIKFLGSGAFGEVFEGTAKNLEETKVAIKTLRKGATLQEKMEFLKEALLMSNFKHEHILRLIGVCLDNNPTLIIMELMEGKDLLSYLRSHRPTKGNPSSLNLKDLLSISVDVTKGCKYLEDMHFVHRDLAARNCLVSCLDPKYRIVKIGDFGLARDIYRNDYYKKEGEGLLPVR